MHILFIVLKVILWVVGSFIALELSLRAWKRVYPFRKPLFRRFKTSKGAKDISSTADHLPPANPLIRSIAVLLLKDFIKCCVENDLTVLGGDTDEQRNDAFMEILSQYYAAKSDESMLSYIKLLRDIKVLELRKAMVDTLTYIMKERFSHAAAKGLQKLYPKHQFTESTYIKDLEWVGKAEIKKKIELDGLLKQLSERDKENSKGEHMTPEQKRVNFIDELMDINKIEGVKYDTTMTVLEYARAQSRKHDHIKNLEKQINKK